MKNIKTTLKQKITLIFFGFTVALACIEIALRIMGGSYLLYRKGLNTAIRDNPNVYRILCLGDSFTLGIGAGKGGDYPAQLAKMLKEGRPEREFKVINAGIGGQNSSELLNSLDANLDKYRPAMVILMVGMNDGHNTHLDNWALGQRGWHARLSSWFTGLRTYKLFKFMLLSIASSDDSQEIKHAGYPSRQDETIGLALAARINEAKRLFENGQDEKAGNLLVETSNKENVWECVNVSKEYNAAGTEEDIIKKILKADEEDEWLRFTLGKIYLKQGKFDEAEEIFNSILENNPDNNYIRFDLAWLYMGQRRYDEAEALLKEAIKVQGGSLRAYRMLSYCNKARGDRKETDDLGKNIRFYEGITDFNLSAIKRRILARGIKLIIMSYPRGNYISDKIMQGVIFVDNHKTFNNFTGEERGRLFSADDHHCNAAGYKVIARNISNCIIGMKDLKYE